MSQLIRNWRIERRFLSLRCLLPASPAGSAISTIAHSFPARAAPQGLLSGKQMLQNWLRRPLPKLGSDGGVGGGGRGTVVGCGAGLSSSLLTRGAAWDTSLVIILPDKPGAILGSPCPSLEAWLGKPGEGKWRGSLHPTPRSQGRGEDAEGAPPAITPILGGPAFLSSTRACPPEVPTRCAKPSRSEEAHPQHLC